MENKDLLIAQGYNRLDVEIAVGGMEEIPQLDPDLMFVKFIMCHEGVNANGDTFTKPVLKEASLTPKYKPIDWEHGQPMIGHILDSEYKENAQGVAYIEATGLVWKFIYPELSAQIKAKAATGELRLSMECYYKDANYQVGDQLFDQQQAELLGIIPYVGREYMGKKVARVFKEVIFGGVGVVANPADKQAVFLAVAKDLGIEDNGIEPDGEYASKNDKLHPVIDFTSRDHTNDSKNAVAVAKFVKAFDKAKSSVVAKFNTKTLKTKEQVVAEVRNSVQTLLSEVASISDSYYRGTANEDVEKAFESSIALNTDEQEAYLLAVEEDYIIYDIIDYSNDSILTMKASIAINDSEVEIDFTNATQFAKKEETEVMAKEKQTVVANETEVVEAVAATDKELNDMLSDENKTNVSTPASKKSDDDNDADKEPDGDEDDKKSKASEFEATIASLQAQLAEANEKVAQYEARFAEMETQKLVANRLSELQEAGIAFSGSRLEKEQAKLRAMSEESYADYKDLLLEVAGKKVVKSADKDLQEYEKKVLQADDMDSEEAGLPEDIKDNQKNKDKVSSEAGLVDDIQDNSKNKDKVSSEAGLVDDIEENDENEDKVSSVASEVEIVVENVKANQLNVETPLNLKSNPFMHLLNRR